MEWPSDEDLQTSAHRRIVRVGDTVRRPAGSWTPAVQALLQHLRDVDFPYAPRPGGIDSGGREVVSFIPGASGAVGWYRIHSEPGLRRFATLLREYHEAVRDFRPRPDLEWALRPSDHGLTSTVGLVDDVIDRQRLPIAHVEELAERGLEPQFTWVRDGTLDQSRQVIAWAEQNRDLFT